MLDVELPSSLSRLGVLGGTFDPVHVGHLIIAEILAHRLKLDHVLILPAANPPHKAGHMITPGDLRLEMIERSIGGAPRLSASSIDLDRPGPSYSSDTLRALRSELGGDIEIYFLMGMDSLRDFPNWHAPDEIARLARLGVARRPGVDVSPREIARQVPNLRNRIEIVGVPLIDVASSDIRDRARNGRPFRFQVVPSVADFIEDRGLYRVSGNQGSGNDER